MKTYFGFILHCSEIALMLLAPIILEREEEFSRLRRNKYTSDIPHHLNRHRVSLCSCSSDQNEIGKIYVSTLNIDLHYTDFTRLLTWRM